MLADTGVDWPLVLGSFSAVVLFLCSVVLVVVVAHRKGISHMHKSLLFHQCIFFLLPLSSLVKLISLFASLLYSKSSSREKEEKVLSLYCSLVLAITVWPNR